MWVDTGCDEDRMEKKESDSESEWELIGGWMARQDDERARKEGFITERKQMTMTGLGKQLSCD